MLIKLHKPTITSYMFTVLLVAQLSGRPIGDPTQNACAHDLSKRLICRQRYSKCLDIIRLE